MTTATTTQKVQIELIKQEQTYMNKKIDNIETMMQKFIDSADEKYASKDSIDRVWKIIWGVIAFAFVAMGWVLMEAILRG